ncbi:MAG: MJ1255/VC2487 family glycosyltransferase [Candidatus Woesearchaeota archaeon]
MVKILYSVNGDGLGHATRSIPIIKALSKKHKVTVLVSSNRSGNFMRKYIKNIVSYEGIRFIYEHNKVNHYKNLTKNTKILLSKPTNLTIINRMIKQHKPEVLLVDCDFPTLIVAKLFKIPVICVCNIHSITELKYDVPKKYKKIHRLQKTLFKILSSKINYHVLTTFFYLPTINKNVFLYPPILRKEILDMTPKRGKDYLVYQTSATNSNLIKILKSFKEKFIVYGYDKDEVDKNIIFRKTNNTQFFKDFKDCKACIANGGYSFISEAISLHKPVLSIPITGIFEQTLNAMQIKNLGYGDMCDSIDRKVLANFIKNNDKYYKNLQKYKKEDNSRIISKIEELIKEVS